MNWAALPAWLAACYYSLAIVAGLRWLNGRAPRGGPAPPISVLKPVRGRDPGFYEAIRSHAEQEYPEFEIIFGTRDPADAALKDIDRLRGEMPGVPIRVVTCPADAPNRKVAVLAELVRHARYPVWLVNDADVSVERDYLAQVAAALGAPETGVVTALYRAAGSTPPARFEALGISTEFAASVLVARFLGVADFALGSTMAFRAETLRQIGGFERLAEYLADDYQLGRQITATGLRVAFADTVVETRLSGATWGEVWRHQLRWSRTIRVSRPGGYCGYAVTHATVWSLLALAGGAWWAAALAMSARLAAAAVIGRFVLQDRSVLPRIWLVPVRDIWGFGAWLAGLFGNVVHWKDERLLLSSDGRIIGKRAV